MTTRALFVGHSTTGVCSVHRLAMRHSGSAHNVQRQHSSPPCPPHNHSLQIQTHITPHASPHPTLHAHHPALSHSSHSYHHFYQALPHHTIYQEHLLHPCPQQQPHIIQPQPFTLPSGTCHKRDVHPPELVPRHKQHIHGWVAYHVSDPTWHSWTHCWLPPESTPSQHTHWC